MGSISSRAETEETAIDVVATEAKENAGIMMKFKISHVGKSGQRKIVAEPTIIAHEGEPAKIEISQKAGATLELSLSVVAKKVSM